MLRSVGVLVLGVVAAPALAGAQATTAAYADQMRAAAALQIAAQQPSSVAPFRVNSDLTARERFSSRAPGATFMIIGAAGVVSGILIGGSGGALLILGGVGLGAYGFYLYTR